MKKEKEELDDRQVANMNVEGMPWYSKNPGMGIGAPKTKEEWLVRQNRKMALKAMLAAFLVGCVFIVGFAIVLGFVAFVWLK